MTDTNAMRAQIAALIEMLEAATMEEGSLVFDHSAEEIGIEVMDNREAILALLATDRAAGVGGRDVCAFIAGYNSMPGDQWRERWPKWAAKVDEARVRYRNECPHFIDGGKRNWARSSPRVATESDAIFQWVFVPLLEAATTPPAPADASGEVERRLRQRLSENPMLPLLDAEAMRLAADELARLRAALAAMQPRGEQQDAKGTK